jgi:hypothetical protein
VQIALHVSGDAGWGLGALLPHIATAVVLASLVRWATEQMRARGLAGAQEPANGSERIRRAPSRAPQ